jgi:hypothetical protein
MCGGRGAGERRSRGPANAYCAELKAVTLSSVKNVFYAVADFGCAKIATGTRHDDICSPLMRIRKL